MTDSMKLHLESIGPINEADINISNITVVGGYNSTGKSTLSKVLYSFLRANSFNRQEIAYKSISKLIFREYRRVSRHLSPEDADKIKRPSFRVLRDCEYYDVLFDFYENMKLLIQELELERQYSKRFKTIDELIRIYEENSTELYISLMRTLMESEFSSNNFNCYIDINGNIVDFKHYDFNDNEAFSLSDGSIIVDDVFYIDSLSILDTFDRHRFLDMKSPNHLEHLKKNLVDKDKDVFDDKINENIIELEKEITDIIHGKFVFELGELKFISEKNFRSDMQNTASGTKQIGLIQLLLANRKLSNSFLIIDEPEVNLHPEWQFKLAKILVLISKKLNISIYINTHSPLFIESVHTYADYYDILDKTTYHLTKLEDNKVNIKEVEENNLSEIYDNLGKPYFDMDILRLEKELD